MASRKKESEGIALLSMYSDEDDEDMEDIKEDDHQQNQQGEEKQEQPPEDGNEYRESHNVMGEDSRTSENSPSFPHQTSTPSQRQPQQHQQLFSSKRSGRRRLTIVDYGHDEAAMSPEPEVTLLWRAKIWVFSCRFLDCFIDLWFRLIFSCLSAGRGIGKW